MPDRLLLASLRETVASLHQVADDQHHLDDELPVAVLLLSRSLQLRRIFVKALDAPLARPFESSFVFLVIVNALGHTADDLDLVDRLDTHTEIVLNEARIDDRAADAHADRADLQIRLPSHLGDRQSRTAKAQELFAHVTRDLGRVGILHVVAVDAKGGQTLLRMGGKHRSEVYGAGALGSVKAPDRLDRLGVHIHRLGAVAPAGRDGQGDGNALFSELLLAGRALTDPSDRRIGDHDLDRLAV